MLMESIEHIGLTLGIPEHGWLPVRLQLNAFVIGCSVSNVLNDPLDELIGAVESCLASSGSGQRTCFWLEPDGYAIDLLLAPPRKGASCGCPTTGISSLPCLTAR